MIDKFDPFEAFGDKEEKIEEFLYIEPLNIPFKTFDVPKISKLPKAEIDSFEESYILKSLKIFQRIQTLDEFQIRNINLN